MDATQPLETVDNRYIPGRCNIGAAEIERRRRAGHLGLAATVVSLAVAQAVGAPPAARLLVGLPAVVGASGYIQARLRFCARFGSLGIVNFRAVGETEQVVDQAALAKDRWRAVQIGAASMAVGAGVATIAALLPRLAR